MSKEKHDVISEEVKKEYLDRDGCICPFCKSVNVRRDGQFDLDKEAWNMLCKDCQAEWIEVWGKDPEITQCPSCQSEKIEYSDWMNIEALAKEMTCQNCSHVFCQDWKLVGVESWQ